MKNIDVLIIGGGPGGSVAASILAKRGLEVVVIEKELYPRFHIGESLLPASMPIFKEIGFYETLSSGKYIQKYGARFIDYRSDEEIYFGFADGLNPDIPMAFEVPRDEFDKDLLAHAKKCGATICQPESVASFELGSDCIEVRTDKDIYKAKYVMDISGRDSLIGKKLQIREVNKDLNNFAVFSHYEGVKRYDGQHEGDITIGLLPNGAWTWIIPFKGAITSVGLVASSKNVKDVTDRATYLDLTLRESERVKNIMSGGNRVTEISAIGNYSHTCETFYGDRWILAGDAAMFLDPIFSSGVHMSISSSRKAAHAVLEALDKGIGFKDENLGANYEQHVRTGGKRFFNLISLFYKGHFVEQMKKTLQRENMRKAFTSTVAGDVWNEENFLFQKNVL